MKPMLVDKETPFGSVLKKRPYNKTFHGEYLKSLILDLSKVGVVLHIKVCE